MKNLDSAYRYTNMLAANGPFSYDNKYVCILIRSELDRVRGVATMPQPQAEASPEPAPTRTVVKFMRSRFRSSCRTCGLAVVPGTQIGKVGDAKWVCVDCARKQIAIAEVAAEGPIVQTNGSIGSLFERTNHKVRFTQK